MNHTRYQIGDSILITKKNWQTVCNSNRSILAYPNDSFVNTVYGLMMNETVGIVTHTFLPSYEITVNFTNDVALHMKDNWITKNN